MYIAIAIIIGTSLIAAALAFAIVRSRQPVEAPAALPVGFTDMNERIGRVLQSMEHLGASHDEIRATVGALVTNPGKRGVWGELTLRRLLEKAGMKPGDDFEEQVILDKGRPDVVVHLGDAGEVVIDSKVPTTHLKAAWEADDEDGRIGAIKAFADAVRGHARDLAGRDYGQQLETTFAPVVMYIPVDGAWEAAREVREDILSEMLAMDIYPAEPSTMGMTLRLLHQHSMNAKQEDVVKAVLKDTRTFLDKVRIHVDHLSKLGANLEKTVGSFDKAVGNLDRSILPAGRRMAAHIDVRIGDLDPVEKGPDLERVARVAERVEEAA